MNEHFEGKPGWFINSDIYGALDDYEALCSEVSLLKDQLKDYREVLEAIKFFNNKGMCECPNHELFSKHACPCTLHKFDIEDLIAGHKVREGKP